MSFPTKAACVLTGAFALVGCNSDVFTCAGTAGEARVQQSGEDHSLTLWLRSAAWAPYGPNTVYQSFPKAADAKNVVRDEYVKQALAYCQNGQIPVAP